MYKNTKAIQTNDVKHEMERISMTRRNRPNPDDRSNNVERLSEMVENTKKNIQEAEISMEFLNPEQKEKIHAKNERRKESINALKEEIQDEKQARKNGEV